MWLGKISIIMYIFSISLTFSGYYVDQVFATNLFTTVTDEGLQTLISDNSVTDTNINAELIFGDFLTGVRVLFGIMTGESITNAFHLLPNFNANWDYAVGILFTTSTLFLWINLITGRDL